MRIGIGFDAHRFADGRPLIIGGVTIPYEKGLAGHSDADVLLHAICDALLGALALGDIGKHFPPSDPKYKDISSLVLLQQVSELVKANGYAVNNIDSIIIAEEPKMAPHIEKMRAAIAWTVEAPVTRVSVKATTTELMGFTGRKEGIAAQAAVTLSPLAAK
ncbi:MAG: 2-C-methyl-D-erythritol 2,4-cyclodiphosphate synthase [Nitrospinae bacterium]|nr:2-C-methyl-D-erythritol 2,4-cyclodiphosphate synthase [Nitrospinota bacterium]